MKNKKKIIKIIILVAVLLVVFIPIATPFLLVGGVIGGLNIAKFGIYSEYYSMRENVCKNPGLNDGFVCQGIAITDDNQNILVSGYMKDDSASRIYVTDLNSNSYYVYLSRDGKVFTGHAGGVATTGDYVYVASGSKIYTFALSDVLNSKNGDVVEIGSGTKVNNEASFVYTDDNYLYVGEFHDGGKYVTEHPYETGEGLNHAIVSRYDINDLSKPNKIYSIRNKVQGMCFTPDGKVVLSTSYGIKDSVYYVYNEADAFDSGETLDGAPVYYFDDYIREVKGPAMSEDLDYYDGKIITLSESACNKYIFGKFFFANKIVTLSF